MTDIIHGRYEVVRSLGMGGMGLVVEARDRHDGRHVALKMLRPMDAMQAHAVERFRREATTLTSLRHPHIVEFLGFLEGPPVMVLELLRGESLRATLRREGSLPIAKAAQITMQIASALSVAHGQGVVHRDLKPSNVFLLEGTPRPHAKLLDFGVAKNTEDDAPPLTRASSIVGSAMYMAPEQIRGEAVHDRSDTYALGLCLYEMVTGKAPFAGSNVHQAMVRVLAGDPLPEHASIPAGLLVILQRATSLVPERRYQSAAELSRALAPFANRELARTQKSPAITTPDSQQPVPVSPTRASSSSRQPTAPMMQAPADDEKTLVGTGHRPAPPHFEPPAPASMTAPLAYLSAPAARQILTPYTTPEPLPVAPIPAQRPVQAAPRPQARFATTMPSTGGSRNRGPARARAAAAPARAASSSAGLWVGGAVFVLFGGAALGGAWLWSNHQSASVPEPSLLDAAPLGMSATALTDAAPGTSPAPAESLQPLTRQAQPEPRAAKPARPNLPTQPAPLKPGADDPFGNR